MELGIDFDDDLFGEPRDRNSTRAPVFYNAKICEPYWFQKSNGDETEDSPHAYKFCADLAIFSGDFKAALKNYQIAKALLPASNQTYLREVEEGIARCHLGLGNGQQAIRAAQAVYESSSNYEQKTAALYLLCQVYQRLGQLQDWLESLQMQLTLHPSKPELWLQLADCYTQLVQHNIQTASPAQQCDPEITHNMMRTRLSELGSSDSGSVTLTSMADYLVITTCLIKARSLYRHVQNTVASFAKERNTKQQEQLNELISALKLPADLIHTCTQALYGMESGEESGESKTLSDEVKVQMLESGTEVVRRNFEVKWFSWNTPS